MQEREEDLATGSVAAGDNIPAAGSTASSTAGSSTGSSTSSSPTIATSVGDESAGAPPPEDGVTARSPGNSVVESSGR